MKKIELIIVIIFMSLCVRQVICDIPFYLIDLKIRFFSYGILFIILVRTILSYFQFKSLGNKIVLVFMNIYIIDQTILYLSSFF